MKKCNICGRTYPDEAAFCGKCGVPLVADEKPQKKTKKRNPDKSHKGTTGTKGTTGAGKGAAKNPTDALLDELDEMIGLRSVKQEVRNRINMIRVARKAAELGSDRVFSTGTLHMVFTGNPGTGKTTVARLLGKIYGSLGVLKKPEVFVECGRSDLVAGYIGQTAPLVKKKFDEARGGVLFIDEAYSLYNPGNQADYGREAIDTMVQYMDSMRDEIMVIVAGYKKEMETFIRDGNPGLSSRFKTVINFEDYSEPEMFEILTSMIRRDGMTLENEAGKALHKVLRSRSKNSNFGNARGVRNLFEDLKEAHDARLGEMMTEGRALTSDMIDSITAEDVKRLVEESGATVSGLDDPESEGAEVEALLAELDQLVGLRAVKQQLRQQVAVVQARKYAEKAGVTTLGEVGPQHMIFAGNPGTGKTTVARLVAKIYEALGIIADSSIFVECGRSDLVGEYIGQTAPKVDLAVRSALGGILFIDEAYSLYQEGSANNADFGKEAISELVKEIENHREELLVIMAGYTREMENMIENANPGLKSRFPVWLDFEDYSVPEMAQIFRSMLSQKGYRLAKKATDGGQKPDAEPADAAAGADSGKVNADAAVGADSGKANADAPAGEPRELLALLEKASQEPNFGNGRGVRNLVDKVIAAQSLRLAAIGYENIHDPETFVEIQSADLQSVMNKL